VTELQVGSLVHVRQRRWLIEAVHPRRDDSEADLVDLACVDDDAQGQLLSVLWQAELDAAVLEGDPWASIGRKGFDDAAMFAAYLHTRRWNSVTATDPTLFQAPFRAGIRIDAYQLEPLRKALALPRVNLFIADDVGLGKTIEAGLIARELLLRRKINAIVVIAPPSMLPQWREELESRFGLSFVTMDREYFAKMRRERGYGVNPWTTHSLFLLSNRRIIDENYAAGLRDWLQEFRAQSLLILDEAHHAAPSSGSRYAIDSKITREVRDLAKRFEHRLFLSATPHNGHSNSFTALLEILDPNRFVRGMDIKKGDLSPVMVRRIKDDIREIEGGFPERKPEQVDIDHLPEDAPELVLSSKFDAYRSMREEGLVGESPSKRAQARLVLINLQKRLLSSIEAFYRTIRVHRDAMRRAAAGDPQARVAADLGNLLDAVGADDERAGTDPVALFEQVEAALGAATVATMAEAELKSGLSRQLAALDELVGLADQYRDVDDARIRELIQWIDVHQCSGVAVNRAGEAPAWNRRRLIIFTEWEDTRRYVERRLRAAIAHTDRAPERIAVYSGATSQDQREDLKHAFNTDPDDTPIRILIATDSAREGLNLQRHCYDLFHFDLPWNPSRIEQRNGRIDRKLQPSSVVYCRYFYYHQRKEDMVLRALVKKTETIREDLGALADVLEGRTADLLQKQGIRHETAEAQKLAIEGISADDRTKAAQQDLEDDAERTRRRARVRREIDGLRTLLERSAGVAGVDADKLRQAVDVGLLRSGGKELRPAGRATKEHPQLFDVPIDNTALASDSSWLPAIDMLRARAKDPKDIRRWRREAAIRPVTFSEPGEIGERAVQLHLEHRFVRRVLSRFVTKGLLEHDLSRACLAIAPDAIPRVVLIGRLSLYGVGGSRLHEELVEVTARWIDPDDRRGKALQPYGKVAEERTLDLLERALTNPDVNIPEPVLRRLAHSISRDVIELTPHLDERCRSASALACEKLRERAKIESNGMLELLEDQAKRIRENQKKWDSPQLALQFNDDEARQLQANKKYWRERVEKLALARTLEPKRISEAYEVKASRIEPVGVAYLWPVSG
jgi:superfamily II DNA or RNA helicase